MNLFLRSDIQGPRVNSIVFRKDAAYPVQEMIAVGQELREQVIVFPPGSVHRDRLRRTAIRADAPERRTGGREHNRSRTVPGSPAEIAAGIAEFFHRARGYLDDLE